MGVVGGEGGGELIQLLRLTDATGAGGGDGEAADGRRRRRELVLLLLRLRLDRLGDVRRRRIVPG